MSTNHGNWTTLRLHCGDGRIQRALLDHAESFGGHSDAFLLPGGIKYLLGFSWRHPFAKLFAWLVGVVAFWAFHLYLSLHKQEVILVIQHEDCGAYGGSKAFPDAAAEKAFHEEQLRKAEALLRKALPQKRIVTAYVLLSGEVLSSYQPGAGFQSGTPVLQKTH